MEGSESSQLIKSLPAVVTAKILTFVMNDLPSILSSRLACQTFNAGANALPLRVCVKLAHSLSPTIVHNCQLVDSRGCSFSNRARSGSLGLGSFLGDLRRRGRRYRRRKKKKKTAEEGMVSGRPANGSEGETTVSFDDCFTFAMAGEVKSDIDDSDDSDISDDDPNTKYFDEEILLRRFLRGSPPAAAASASIAVEISNRNHAGNTKPPFHHFLLYARCLQVFPKEVALCKTEKYGQIILPIRPITRMKTTATRPGNRDNPKDDIPQVSIQRTVGGELYSYMNYDEISPIGDVDNDGGKIQKAALTKPSCFPIGTKCPKCISSTLQFRVIRYKIDNTDPEISCHPNVQKLRFVPLDTFNQEDTSDQKQKGDEFGTDQEKKEGISITLSGVYDEPLNRIDQCDITCENSQQKMMEGYQYIFLFYCEGGCNDFGIISPVGICKNEPIAPANKCSPFVPESIGRLTTRCEIGDVFVRDMCGVPYLPCLNIIPCLSCTFNEGMSPRILSCDTCNRRLCRKCQTDCSKWQNPISCDCKNNKDGKDQSNIL